MAKRKRARTRTTVISSAVVLAVIVGGWMGYRAYAAEAPGSYVTGTVTKGNVDQYLDLSGTVSASDQSSVGFPASGTVTSVDVELGDQVHAGQKLATMDDSQLKLAVIQAKADLASAKDEVTQAKQAADNSTDTASQSTQTSSTTGSAGGSQGTGSEGSAFQGGQGSGSGTSGSGTQGSGTQGSGSQGAGTHRTGSQSSGSQSGGTHGSGTQGSQGSGSQGSGSQGSGAQGSGSQGSGSHNPSSPGAGTGGTQTGGKSAGSSDQAELKQLQQLQGAVTKDAAALGSLQANVTTAVSNAASTCRATAQPAPTAPSTSATTEPSAPTTSASDVPTNPSTAPTSASPTSTAPAQTDDQCEDAITDITTAQAAVSTEQTQLTTDTKALTDALQKAAQADASAGNGNAHQPAASAPTTPPTSQPSSNTTAPGDQASKYQCVMQAPSGNQSSSSNSGNNFRTSTGNSGQSSVTGNTPASSGGSGSNFSRSSGSGGSSNGGSEISGGQGSTMTVAEANAAVTTAKINVKLAEQQLSEATITSPINGTVASLDFAKGDSVSTSDKIVIMGHGSAVITVDVPGTMLDSIKKGQQVTVGTKDSAGKISSIGLLPNSDSDGSEPSYPVTITVADPGTDLADGTTTMADIMISQATNVVQVPVSAVTQNGSTGTVTVLKDDKPQRTLVKIGAVGSTTVQITSGLSVGQTVVIANRNEPLPSSNTNSNIRTVGGQAFQFAQGGPGGGPNGGR